MAAASPPSSMQAMSHRWLPHGLSFRDCRDPVCEVRRARRQNHSHHIPGMTRRGLWPRRAHRRPLGKLAS